MPAMPGRHAPLYAAVRGVKSDTAPNLAASHSFRPMARPTQPGHGDGVTDKEASR
ncbi:protein of unknown function [Rhodovastum atsumiense]|nr:protein of unknown function [Rhodovastum atsumiense]